MVFTSDKVNLLLYKVKAISFSIQAEEKVKSDARGSGYSAALLR
jgi:hypothetical protein